MTDLRYIIRPGGISKTPRLLADALGLQTRRWPNKQAIIPDEKRDVLLTWPKGTSLYWFASRDKFTQRANITLQGVFTVPCCAGGAIPDHVEGQQYVVRPLRHSQGRDYRLTDNPQDYNPRTEYISVCIRKKREYRIIFVSGKPVVMLRKKPVEDASPYEAWNHTTGSFFQTINNWTDSILGQTNCLERLRECKVIQKAHLVGVDIIWDGHHYYILEYNFCPALSIETNLQKVVEAIRSR